MDKDLEWLEDVEINYFDFTEVDDLVKVNHLTDLGEDACYGYDYCGEEYEYSEIEEGSICVVNQIDYLNRNSSDCGASLDYGFDPDEVVKSIELFVVDTDGTVNTDSGFWFHKDMVNLLPVSNRTHK